jgi:Fe-S-cluster containining protein
MQRHREFLEGVERWFASVRRKHAGQMQCGRGCAQCCHGIFDISLPDAVLLAEGLAALPPELLERVKEAARAIQEGITKSTPELSTPHLLHVLSAERIDAIVERANSPRCPLLGEDNQCLVYEHRPLACRLEGVPMVDVRDGLFGDWCELNFTRGVPEEALTDLQLDYYDLQKVEEIATEILSDALLRDCRRDATVFIASVIADFESYWKSIL